VLPEDNIQTLTEKLRLLGAEALLKSLELLETGNAAFAPQDEGQVSWTKKIKKEDGRIRWEEAAFVVQNKIRAFAGWPGSFSFYRGKRLLVIRAQARPNEAIQTSPGTILKASAAEGIWVATGQGALGVEILQIEGRKAMNATDFLKGFPLKAGSILE